MIDMITVLINLTDSMTTIIVVVIVITTAAYYDSEAFARVVVVCKVVLEFIELHEIMKFCW